MTTTTSDGAAKKTLPLIVEEEADGGFVIECPILTGCYAQGDTYEEALANMQEVISLALEEDDNRLLVEGYNPLSITFKTIVI